MTIEDDACEECRLATDPKTGCMKAGYCRHRDGVPGLGRFDPPCREVMTENYVDPVQYRGEPVLRHEWFINGAWRACETAVCRECQRRKACTAENPMA